MSARVLPRERFPPPQQPPSLRSDTAGHRAGVSPGPRTACAAGTRVSPSSVRARYVYFQSQGDVGRCMCIFHFSNEISALFGFLQMTLFPQKEKMDNLETLKLDTIFFWSCLKKKNVPRISWKLEEQYPNSKQGVGST